MTTPDEPASQNARRAVVMGLQNLGCVDADEQRRVCAAWVHRPIASRTELTEREARKLAAYLRTMPRAELDEILARPAPVADVELPPGAIVCGPGPVTEGDAATVRAFAEALDAGPAAVRAFALGEDAPVTTEPCPWCSPDDPPGTPCLCRPEETPGNVADAGPEVLAALDAYSAEQQAKMDPEPGHDLAACTEHPDCRRAAEFYDVTEPPADVEEAAVQAVERFRARAGVVPPAPDLSSLPPRVPVVLPPRPDRMCPPSICWCGECAHWSPMKPPDYSKTPGSIDYEKAERWRY